MQNVRIVWALTAVAAAAVFVVGVVRKAQGGQAGQAQQAVPMTLKGVAVQLTFGLKDKTPNDWDGELKVSEGKVVRLEAQLLQDERIDGSTWKLRSRQGVRRAPTIPVQLLAFFDAPPTTKVEVTTKQGGFSFTLGDLKFGSPSTFLDGAAIAERVPPTHQLTTSPTEDDFPACAVAPDGTVWCAYVAYQHGNPIDMEAVNQGKFDSLLTKGNGEQVKLIEFDGKVWRAPMDVTEAGLDVWHPTVAVDSRGVVWVIWSQNVKGNWDLYGRSYDAKAGRLGEVRRLTREPGADINAVAVNSPSGVWLAWQGWRKDNFDIWLAPLSGDGLMRPHRVSTSPANDWNPAIAVTAKGHIWIAWDSYDKGDYDVFVRGFAEGKLGEPIAVAASPRFEARPSIVVDKQDRLWIAYEDSDPNWAKDFGSRWKGKSGVPFYLDRNIIVRCLADGRLMQTKGEVKSEAVEVGMDTFASLFGVTPAQLPSVPSPRRQRISLPRLGLDDEGRLWLLFRRHPLISGAGERWESYATYYDGDKWSGQIPLPHSDNTLDNRPTLVTLKGKGLLAVYSSDGRTIGTNTAVENNLYAALLDLDGVVQAPALVAAEAKGEGKPVEPVHPNEAEEVQRIRSYRIAVGGKTYQLLRGEFHRHTEFSSHDDQDGPLEEIWRYGLDVARMDWIGAGDHDYGGGQEYSWWLTQKQTDLYHHPPAFVPMFTHERSVSYPSGHRNVMFAKRGVRVLPRLAEPKQRELLFGTPEAGSPDVKNLYAYLKRFDGICAVHTSATGMGTDWRDNDPQVEPVVEIYQGHRQNYEEPKAPKAPKDAQDCIGSYQPAGFVWNALAKGYRLGFQVSSDHISTHISYAIVLVEKPTREGILDAFKKRHSYGANDNILLDVRCGDHLMGDEFTLKSPPQLDIIVQGTAPIARIDIVRQVDKEMPTYVYAFEPKMREVKLSWTDIAAKAGALNMYYVRVMQEDGKMAWASPLWVRYEP